MGDSILDSIKRNDETTRQEGIYEREEIHDLNHLSWAEHALPPDQVIASVSFVCSVCCINFAKP